MTSHFLFVAGALRERSSRESAELQLGHQLWGLRTALIGENLGKFLSRESQGLVYVLKEGLCARFAILSDVQPVQQLDAFVRDELRDETRYGFVTIAPLQRWQSSPEQSIVLLQRVLDVPDATELTRRLSLGMHRLTQDQHDAIVAAMGVEA